MRRALLIMLMALLYGSAAPATITVVQKTTCTAATPASTTLTCTTPTGTASGDLIAAQFVYATGKSITLPSSTGTVDGWHLIRADSDPTSSVSSANYYAYAGASPAANYTFTCNAACYATGGVVTYRRTPGWDTGISPVDVSSVNTGSGSVGTTITATSVTTTVANDYLLISTSWTAVTGTVTPYSGFNVEWNQPFVAGTNYGDLFVDEETGAAGATGDQTASSTAALTWVAQQIALQNAIGDTPTPTLTPTVTPTQTQTITPTNAATPTPVPCNVASDCVPFATPPAVVAGCTPNP